MQPEPLKPPPHTRYPRSSSFYALDNCDASFTLSQASGEEPPTPYAFKGTEVHGVLSGKIPRATVDDATQALADDLAGQRANALRLWVGLDAKIEEETIETRLWLRQGLIPLYSGQPDVFAKSDSRVFLSDYKSGWHPLDHWVATNSQLRAYVPLIDEHYHHALDEITAAIHKPGKKSPPAIFFRSEIDQARAWAIDVVRRARDKHHARPSRGPWCTYCSGKVLCPLWKDEIRSFSDLATALVSDIPDLALREIAPKLDLAKTVIDKLSARLYERVRLHPEIFTDWRFEPGQPSRKIDSVPQAYIKLVQDPESNALSPEEFLACCRIAIGDIELCVRKNRRLSVKDAQAWMAATLQGIMHTRRPRDLLVYDPRPKELPPPSQPPDPAA
jgi:hypothetical protein